MAAPTPQSAPAWANELALAYESGASSQFMLFGNVHDRLAVADRLVSLVDFLEDTLLKGFGVVLSYDPGSGLNIERGGDLVARWKGAELKQQMREPPQAVQWIDRYLRYLGNLRSLGSNEKTPNVAVIARGIRGPREMGSVPIFFRSAFLDQRDMARRHRLQRLQPEEIRQIVGRPLVAALTSRREQHLLAEWIARAGSAAEVVA